MSAVLVVLGGLALLGGAIAALPTIWRAVKVMARAPFIIEGIAQEFSPNGGNSLRDRIDRLDGRLEAHVAESDRKHDEAINLVREMADLSDLIRRLAPSTHR